MAGVHHPLFEDWLCLVDILLGLVSLRSETLNLKVRDSRSLTFVGEVSSKSKTLSSPLTELTE